MPEVMSVLLAELAALEASCAADLYLPYVYRNVDMLRMTVHGLAQEACCYRHV